MPDYIVTRSTGWPIDNPTTKLHAIVELTADDAKAGVAAGYLVPADPSHPVFRASAETFAPILKAHAEAKAVEAKKKAATSVPEPEQEPPVEVKTEGEPTKK
jgi:hypothetical protein